MAATSSCRAIVVTHSPMLRPRNLNPSRLAVPIKGGQGPALSIHPGFSPAAVANLRKEKGRRRREERGMRWEEKKEGGERGHA